MRDIRRSYNDRYQPLNIIQAHRVVFRVDRAVNKCTHSFVNIRPMYWHLHSLASSVLGNSVSGRGGTGTVPGADEAAEFYTYQNYRRFRSTK